MTTKDSFYEKRYDSIQVLRGIAALLVVLEHIRFLNCGAFGVDIFFCISGFMIMLTTQKSTRHFFRKRLLRILPFYYLMTLGTYLLLLLLPGMFEQTQSSPVLLLKSLLFIPFDIGGGVLQPLLRIGWTVNCEMFFYLLFGLSFRISHRFRGLICSGLLAVLAAAAALLPNAWAPLVFYGNPVMLEFALGILAFYAAQGLYNLYSQGKLPGLLAPVCLFSSLGLFLCLILTKHSVNVLGLRRLLYWGLPAFFIVLAFFTAGLFLKMPSVMVRLGDISFSLYLIHYYPILFIDRKLCDFSALNAASLAGAALGTLLVIGLAYISWILIEKKLTGCLRRLLIHEALEAGHPCP